MASPNTDEKLIQTSETPASLSTFVSFYRNTVQSNKEAPPELEVRGDASLPRWSSKAFENIGIESKRFIAEISEFHSVKEVNPSDSEKLKSTLSSNSLKDYGFSGFKVNHQAAQGDGALSHGIITGSNERGRKVSQCEVVLIKFSHNNHLLPETFYISNPEWTDKQVSQAKTMMDAFIQFHEEGHCDNATWKNSNRNDLTPDQKKFNTLIESTANHLGKTADDFADTVHNLNLKNSSEKLSPNALLEKSIDTAFSIMQPVLDNKDPNSFASTVIDERYADSRAALNLAQYMLIEKKLPIEDFNRTMELFDNYRKNDISVNILDNHDTFSTLAKTIQLVQNSYAQGKEGLNNLFGEAANINASPKQRQVWLDKSSDLAIELTLQTTKPEYFAKKFEDIVYSSKEFTDFKLALNDAGNKKAQYTQEAQANLVQHQASADKGDFRTAPASSSPAFPKSEVAMDLPLVKSLGNLIQEIQRQPSIPFSSEKITPHVSQPSQQLQPNQAESTISRQNQQDKILDQGAVAQAAIDKEPKQKQLQQMDEMQMQMERKRS